MYTLVISGIVFFLFGLLLLFDKENFFLSIARSVMAGVVGVIIAFFVVSFFSFIFLISSRIEIDPYPKEEITLASLENNSSYFLESRQIEGKPYYFFNRRLADGCVQRQKIPADSKAEIQECLQAGGYIEVYGFHTNINPRWENWLFIGCDWEQYKIFIPRGSFKMVSV